MIARLEGILMEAWNSSCIVATRGGVGYSVALPAHTFGNLPAKGSAVAFYTSLVVREDALELFGFDTFEERQTFLTLTGISKVGARTALAILSLHRPEALRRIILEGDLPALTRVSGIGQKTAQHILLELKYKLGSMASAADAALPKDKCSPSVFGDALAALVNLGYSEEECSPHLKSILLSEPDIDVASALRGALKALAKGK